MVKLATFIIGYTTLLFNSVISYFKWRKWRKLMLMNTFCFGGFLPRYELTVRRQLHRPEVFKSMSCNAIYINLIAQIKGRRPDPA